MKALGLSGFEGFNFYRLVCWIQARVFVRLKNENAVLV